MKSCLCYFFICLIGSIYSFHLAASISADFISVFFSRQNSSLALHNKHSFAEDSAGAYPLVLRISVRETSILTVKISKKDNPVENYKRAYKIFNIDSQPVCRCLSAFQVQQYTPTCSVYLMFLYPGSCLGFFRPDKPNINE
jgi:hypothetical protein